MNNNFENGPNRQRDCMDDFQDWWASLTWFVRFLIATCLTLWIVDTLFMRGLLLATFFNLPTQTIIGFQIWRLSTACFVHMGLFDLMISLYSIYRYIVKLQRDMGTAYLIIDFFVKQALLQLVFSILAIFINLTISSSALFYSLGLWTMVILYISIDSFSNPEEDTMFLCFPVVIKKKWYPIAIIGFFYLMSMMMGGGQLPLDFIAACLFGWIEVQYFDGVFMRLSKEKLLSYESKFPFKFISTSANFVLINNAGSDFLAPSNGTRAPLQLPVTNNFQGRGVNIGGRAPAPVQPYRNPVVANANNPNTVVINPSASSGDSNVRVFSGKAVTIGGANPPVSKLVQQAEEDQNTTNNKHMKFEDQKSNDEETNDESKEQKDKQKQDNYSALNEETNSELLI